MAEACRNVSCTGAEPIALTDCLNFGNPENPGTYYQLEWCIRGMARACRVLGVPVVSGNVSLYNETQGEPIYPTPVVGCLGLLEDVKRHTTMEFKAEGDLVVLLGAADVRGRPRDLAGSEYLEVVHGLVLGRPTIDLELEKRIQELCRRSVAEGIATSAHDCADGGLLVALAESCMSGDMGFRAAFPVKGRWDSAFFGEAQSRVILSLPPESFNDLARLATEAGVPLVSLGKIESSRRFIVDGFLDIGLDELAGAWRNTLNNTAR